MKKMKKKKKKELDPVDEEFGRAKAELDAKLREIKEFYEVKPWKVKVKQAMVKAMLDVYREVRYNPPKEKEHDFYFLLEKKDGMEFTASWYTPGKSPGSYQVKENAWGLKLVEDEEHRMHFSRVGNCPIILPETNPGHAFLLRWMFDRGCESSVYFGNMKVLDNSPQYCLCTLRVNRQTPYRRLPKPYPPVGYTEFLPFILELKIRGNSTV